MCWETSSPPFSATAVRLSAVAPTKAASEVAGLSIGFAPPATAITDEDEDDDDDPDEDEDDDEEADEDDFDEAEYLDLLPSLIAVRIRRIVDPARRREAIQGAIVSALRANKIRIDGRLEPISDDDDDDETSLKLLPRRTSDQIRKIVDPARRRIAIDNAIKANLRGYKVRLDAEARNRRPQP